MKEGVTTTRKRRKGEGLAAPLMGGCPSLLYICWTYSSSPYTLVLPSPTKLLPQIRLGLAKLCRIVSSSFTHFEK
jgi:hypothetical protein